MTGLKQYRLSKEALDALRTDAMLSGDVATVLGVTSRYLDALRLKMENGTGETRQYYKLTQYAVVELISKRLGKKPKEILELVKQQQKAAA